MSTEYQVPSTKYRVPCIRRRLGTRYSAPRGDHYAMNRALRLLRPHATRLVALALILTAYGFTQPPGTSGSDRAALASHFHFTRTPLPELKGYTQRSVRAVSPSLQRIS